MKLDKEGGATTIAFLFVLIPVGLTVLAFTFLLWLAFSYFEINHKFSSAVQSGTAYFSCTSPSAQANALPVTQMQVGSSEDGSPVVMCSSGQTTAIYPSSPPGCQAGFLAYALLSSLRKTFGSGKLVGIGGIDLNDASLYVMDRFMFNFGSSRVSSQGQTGMYENYSYQSGLARSPYFNTLEFEFILRVPIKFGPITIATFSISRVVPMNGIRQTFVPQVGLNSWVMFPPYSGSPPSSFDQNADALVSNWATSAMLYDFSPAVVAPSNNNGYTINCAIADDASVLGNANILDPNAAGSNTSGILSQGCSATMLYQNRATSNLNSNTNLCASNPLPPNTGQDPYFSTQACSRTSNGTFQQGVFSEKFTWTNGLELQCNITNPR
jgi:hypothetical protein